VADRRDPVQSPDRYIRFVTVISVVLLAVIAAAVSFGHMRELALRHGEAQWSATLIPLSADGMVVAATAAVGLAVALAVAAVTPDGMCIGHRCRP
jgi:hypothetical protein